MRHSSRFLLVLFVYFCVNEACPAELSEVQVKSAYVFNFIKFVQWPADAVKRDGRINLCVIGNDELQASLSTLSGRKAGEYEIQAIPHSANMALSSCHVLYIGNLEHHRLVPIIKSLGAAPILTISDIPGFAERGGGIGLLNRDDKLLFEINLASTRKAELHLSSQMLNLAVNIFGK